MKKIILILTVFLAYTVVHGQIDNPKFTVVQLKEDFSLLRTALEQAHPALYKFSSKSSMDSLFNAIDKSIDKEMTEAQFLTLISPVFGKIKCGHTRIYPSDNYRKYVMTSAKMFPFEIKIIDNKLYIVKNLSADSTVKLGTEIDSINKVPASKILPELLSRTWADGLNQTMKYKVFEQSFNIWYSIVYGECDNFSIVAVSPETHKTISFTVPAITMAERKKVSAIRTKKPIDRQPIQFKLIDDLAQTAVLTVKTFSPEIFKHNGTDYNKFIDSIFTIIKNKNIPKLIIDLRDNNGGDVVFMSNLFSYIADKEYNLLNYAQFKTNKPLDYLDKDTTDFYKFITDSKGNYFWKDTKDDWYETYQPNKNNFKGKVYILINGGSFSSSGFFCSLFQYYKRGKIIGEEAGGSSVCNDCHDNLVLPNTKINTEIARCTFSMNLPGIKYDGHGIIPDKLVKTTLNDIINDNDSVLKYAIADK